MRPLKVTPEEIKIWFAEADESQLQDFLDFGLLDLMSELEEDDFFGTEGFNKRFS